MPSEIWKEIPGSRQTSRDGLTEHRFEASNTGRVRRVTVSVYEPEITTDGYERVRLGRDGGKHSVHRLVAAAFSGSPVPQELQVNHIDGDRRNNEPSNLEVVTCKENIRHAYQYGSKKIGGDHPRAKLSDEEVEDIRNLFASGATAYRIWTLYPQVGYGHIKGICSGRYRKNQAVSRETPVRSIEVSYEG